MQVPEFSKDKYIGVATNYSHPTREIFLRFQTNIQHYLGLKVGEDEFIELMKVKHYNSAYLRKENELPSLVLDSELPIRPSIYVTLHLGCYILNAACLINTGYKLCIPVTNRVFTEQVQKYELKFNTILHQTDTCIKFVDVESPRGIVELIRYIKAGYSILFYIDGNSGIGGMERKDNKLTEVPFFNNSIFVRRGIGFLSKKLKLDIYPLYTIYSENLNKQVIHVLSKIPYSPNQTDKDITNIIWKRFKKPILSNFEQWEPWLYADCYYNQAFTHLPISNSYRYNREYFKPIIKDNTYFLYDGLLNKFIKMNKITFQTIIHFYENADYIDSDSLKQSFSDNILKQLISLGVFIK